MIVAGEASGDLHGARLMAAMKHLNPNLAFCGMGGGELRAEGMDILYDAGRMAVVGLIEVLAHVNDIWAARRILTEELRSGRIDLLVLIDYPDFNLLLAEKARQLGVPVFYYISPQVWAWRSGRVKKIGRLVDRMAVILPFEKDFYAARGFQVDYVGHPLLDSVKREMPREAFCARFGLDPERVMVGLLPGSRKKEIITMLPLFLAAAAKLAEVHDRVTFLLPLAPGLKHDDLAPILAQADGIAVQVISENRYDLMASCDLVAAASGTVTLELAILNTPMVVSYRMSPLTWQLGRRFIKVKFASLVNLIAGAAIVPELLQERATPENLLAAMEDLWPGKAGREAQLAGLAGVRERLGRGGASRRAARLALSLVPAGK